MPRFNAAELETLKQVDARAKNLPGFDEWLTDLIADDTPTAEEILAGKDEAGDDLEGLRLDYLYDFMADHGMGIEEHGLITFDTLGDLEETLIGDSRVALYHHTSTSRLKKIRKEGLIPDAKPSNPHMNSQAGVYLTTELGGPAVEGYRRNATRRGGQPVTLTVACTLDELSPDPDDADISSGSRQFIRDRVPTQDIVD